MWPLFDRTADPERTRTGVHPIFFALSEENHTFVDILYPFILYRSNEKGARFYFWPLFSRTTYHDPDEGDDIDSYLNPIFFWGSGNKDRDTGETTSYFAFFPVAGTFTGGMFGNDRTTFFLFPLFIHRDREFSTSTTIVWPLFTYFHGTKPEKTAWRLFPLVVWQSTDGGAKGGKSWGLSIVWPIFTRGFEQTPLGDKQDHIAVFPLFRYTWGTRGGAISLIWPIFEWSGSTDTKGETNKVKRQFIPFYYHLRQPGTDTYSFIWPLTAFTWSEHRGTASHERYVLPVYWEFFRKDQDGREQHTLKIWPLYQAERHYDGTSWSEALSLPLVAAPQWRWRNNYEALWQFYRTETGPGRKSLRFLGNLFALEERKDRWSARVWPIWAGGATSEASESAWLLGLFRTRTENGSTGISLFFLPYF